MQKRCTCQERTTTLSIHYPSTDSIHETLLLQAARLETHDRSARQERTSIQRFPETIKRLNTQESSLACCKALLLPGKVSFASVHCRRCQVVERAAMCESASIWYRYDPEVVLPRYSDAWSVHVVLPVGEIHCKSLLLYLMADRHEQNGTRKQPGRKPENNREGSFSQQLSGMR